jgi:hypothetical protein
MIPQTAEHPAYGTGERMSFNPESGIGHFVFRNPPGMRQDGRTHVYPTAEMVLVNGQWTVDRGRFVSVAEI